MQRLGLGYETLRAANERIVYVSITGYGQEGPWAPMAGHDINYLALGGALDGNGVAAAVRPRFLGFRLRTWRAAPCRRSPVSCWL